MSKWRILQVISVVAMPLVALGLGTAMLIGWLPVAQANQLAGTFSLPLGAPAVVGFIGAWRSRRRLEPQRRRGRPGVATTARGITDLAARVLPAAARARYREEYRAELYDLAEEASRWYQMRYALRVISQVPKQLVVLRQRAVDRAG